MMSATKGNLGLTLERMPLEESGMMRLVQSHRHVDFPIMFSFPSLLSPGNLMPELKYSPDASQ